MSEASREEFYRYAAEGFAGTAVIKRLTAIVHVEGSTDIYFWRKIFNQFYPQGKFEFVSYSKSYHEGRGLGANASGSMHCLSYRNYLSDKFFVCIDSDERYLKQEPNINIKNYIFQTYTYSIENHYCFAPKLNYACVFAFGLDVKRYLPLLTNNFFDYRKFLAEYSVTIYELFLWHMHFAEAETCELGIIPFSNMVTIKGNLPYAQVKNHGEKLILRLREKVDAKTAKLRKTYPDVDIEKLKLLYAKFGVKPDNVYLFIRGHNLMSLVCKIGERCCEYLLDLEKRKLGNDKRSINALHQGTKSFKSVVQRKLWYDKYECMHKIKKDVDEFYRK